MNEFSILCRVIGSLFNRQPQDPLLVPLFTLLREGKLKAQWPLEQDELLTRLQQNSDPHWQRITTRCLSAANAAYRLMRHNGQTVRKRRMCVRSSPHAACR